MTEKEPNSIPDFHESGASYPEHDFDFQSDFINPDFDLILKLKIKLNFLSLF